MVLNITDNRQIDINYQYWENSETNNRSKNRLNIKMKNAFKFFLKNSDGLRIQACKLFFINILGFKIINDRVLDDKIKPNKYRWSWKTI